jgi:hypothetical protein
LIFWSLLNETTAAFFEQKTSSGTINAYQRAILKARGAFTSACTTPPDLVSFGPLAMRFLEMGFKRAEQRTVVKADLSCRVSHFYFSARDLSYSR